MNFCQPAILQRRMTETHISHNYIPSWRLVKNIQLEKALHTLKIYHLSKNIESTDFYFEVFTFPATINIPKRTNPLFFFFLSCKQVVNFKGKGFSCKQQVCITFRVLNGCTQCTSNGGPLTAMRTVSLKFEGNLNFTSHSWFDSGI